MDNYPIGAANDPDAPYNEIPPREVDVRIEQAMIKETTCFLDEGDDFYEGWVEDQVRGSSLGTTLVKCERIVKELLKTRNCFAGVLLWDLKEDLHSWTEGNLIIEEL